MSKVGVRLVGNCSWPWDNTHTNKIKNKVSLLTCNQLAYKTLSESLPPIFLHINT